MQRYLTCLLLLFVAAALQGNWPAWAAIKGATPDLMLVVLIVSSLGEDPAFGAGLGFAAGFIRGSLVGDSIGSFIVTRTITGFLASMVTTRLSGGNPLVPAAAAGSLTFLCEAIFFLVSPVPSLSAAMRALLAESAYNAILALIFYWIVQSLETRRKIKLARSRFSL